jgi:hypothetical protein
LPPAGLGELFGEAGLADTGLAAEPDQAAAAREEGH